MTKATCQRGLCMVTQGGQRSECPFWVIPHDAKPDKVVIPADFLSARGVKRVSQGCISRLDYWIYEIFEVTLAVKVEPQQ